MDKGTRRESAAIIPRTKEGHVTGAEDNVPKSARQKTKTTLVTRKTGTSKPTPRKP
jgi:hypothetical protein